MAFATKLQQETQIHKSLAADISDAVAPSEANFETNTVSLLDDLNNIRSQLSNLLEEQTGNWWDDLSAPSALEAGTQRGVNTLNDALHAVEKKRVLTCLWGLNSASIASNGDTFDILGTGELPGNTTAAVGAVATLGSVVAEHAGTFGTHSLDEVAGPTAISPKNLVQIVDAVTRDPILDAGDKIYGLLQTEDGTDGHTITDATTTRAQISFVKINGSGNDLIAISSGAMDGQSYDYCYVERVRLEDLNEANFLGGASIDVPAGTTVTRQAGYDNQGATPVDITAQAILDLEGAGLGWLIRDDLEAPLFGVVEGSAGGTSQVNVHADVDEFDVDAAVVDFASGILTGSGGTGIDIGAAAAGEIQRAADLTLSATGAGELIFQDSNMIGEATWAGPGVKLSETQAEVAAYETAFGGEVSIFDALVQAKNSSSRRKVVATVNSNTAADTDMSGPANDNNLSADLGDLSGGTFEDDYDIFLNGDLLWNGANAAANHDVYPGTALANGQLRFEDKLKSGDVITVIDHVA